MKSRYPKQHAPWNNGWHALTIYECVAELIQMERDTGIQDGKRPPRAPGIVVDEWRMIAVREANEAIKRMMEDEKDSH